MRLLCYGNNGKDEGSQYSSRRRRSNAQAKIKVVTGSSAVKESPMVMAASREKFSIGQEMQKAFLKGEESILIQAEATSMVQLNKFDAYIKELCGQYPGMMKPYKEEGRDHPPLNKVGKALRPGLRLSYFDLVNFHCDHDMPRPPLPDSAPCEDTCLERRLQERPRPRSRTQDGHDQGRPGKKSGNSTVH